MYSQMINKTVNRTLNKTSNILILHLNFRETIISHFLVMIILSIIFLFNSIIGFIEENMSVIQHIKTEEILMLHKVKLWLCHSWEKSDNHS